MYSLSWLHPLPLTWYNFEPQSAQNTMPDNTGISPRGVGLRLPSRIRFTVWKVSSLIMASCVSLKTCHSEGAFLIVLTFLTDYGGQTMNSQTSLVAEQVRLRQWAAQIQECQSCPADMKVETWCNEHGITKANYYYRLRRVRKACLTS